MRGAGGHGSDLLSKADKLRLATLVVVTGFAVAVILHYVQGAYCGLRYPYGTYLHRPGDSFEVDPALTTNHDFSDLLAVCTHAADRDPYFTAIPRPFTGREPFPSNYFPFGAMLPYPLTRIPYPWAVAVFSGGFVLFLGWFNWTFMRTGQPLADAIPIVALTLMNYPAQMIVDRGNLEAVVFMFLAGFVMLGIRRRLDGAAGLLGAAIAMKAVPVVFLPFCHRLAGRRGLLVAVGTAGLLTLAALLAMRSPVAASLGQFATNLANYSKATGNQLEPANHGSGFAAAIVVTAWLSQLAPVVRPVFVVLQAAYPAIAAVILGLAMAASMMLPLKLWELATVAAVCLVGLPVSSPDYRLISMMIPFVLFVNSRTERRVGVVVTILFALLLTPKAWLVLTREVTLNSLINPLLLAGLLGLVLERGLDRRRAAGASATDPSPAAAAATTPPRSAAAARPRRRR